MPIIDVVTDKAIETWRSNPSWAAHELLGVKLIPIQRIVLNKFWNSKNGICLACRGFGKTFVAANIASLQGMLYPGRRIGCLSASFRQAKQIFEEIRALWQGSEILQQCTEQRPIISNDACRLRFKPTGGKKPSEIVALPLADGAKIRGQRFHTLLIDECVHVPPHVFNMVLRPMGATKQDPVVAMEIEQEKDMILAKGYPKEIEEELIKALEESERANQILEFTSGYYSMNYVYELYTSYSKRMHGLEEGNDYSPKDFSTFQIPHYAIPKGFLDKDALSTAKKDMSPIEFKMEYEAAWITDSGGFFKISQIDSCRSESLGLKHKVLLQGHSDKQYILTMDPARVQDFYAFLVSEFDTNQGMKIVYAEQHQGKTTPEMVDRIFYLCKTFNIIRIDMDAAGGGREIADYLARGKPGYDPIYDMENESYSRLKGRHILRLINFSSSWNNAANHRALNLLENRKIVFPEADIGGGGTDARIDAVSQVHKTIEKMITQILNITPTETRSSSNIRFDLPDSGGGFVKHKDLYSAFLLACNLAYELDEEHTRPSRPILPFGLVVPIR